MAKKGGKRVTVMPSVPKKPTMSAKLK